MQSEENQPHMNREGKPSLAERARVAHQANLAHAYERIAQSGKTRINEETLASAIEERGNPRPSQAHVDRLIMQYAAAPEEVDGLEAFLDYIEQLDREGGN